MRKWPIIPTIIAAAAVITMIALGIWQLQRKDEKEALLARYGNATELEPVAYPAKPDAGNLPLYRQSAVECAKVTGWRSIAGNNIEDELGFAHLASCQTENATAAEAIVAVGWSPRPQPPEWNGGTVTGIIAPHKPEFIKLVVTNDVAGLKRLTMPSPANIPNNHLLYAIQWFIFAFAATVIFLLAARKKQGR